MQEFFNALADTLRTALRGNERFTCWFSGEDTDFARFNHAKIRQAGRVTQRGITIDLIDGQRHVGASLTLSGELTTDTAKLRTQIEQLRPLLASVPDDPHLLYATEVNSSSTVSDPRLPPAAEMVNAILDAGRDYDLVGLFASGAQYHGFANSLGQRNWHASHSVNLDWTLYLDGAKAVKSRYAGFDWEPAVLQQRMAQAAEQLALLERPARAVKPGQYRAFLTPAALEEIFALLAWGGFGLRAQRTGQSPLRRLVEGSTMLHPDITLSEHTAAGIAPDFQAAGFIKPPQIMLIENGRHKTSLVSPRSAAEYNIRCNGAGGGESPQSLELAAGGLATADALAQLDTGLYIGNLWYLNYSDRSAARITGMTRFATFWVENGQIQAPANALRFDDTFYQLFGSRLLALTQERELLLDPSTYASRSSASMRLPGALVDRMRFTL